MIIPYSSLAPELLTSVLENLITEDASDISHLDLPMDDKVGQVITQLKAGQLYIAYDDETQSTSLITKEHARALQLFIPNNK